MYGRLGYLHLVHLAEASAQRRRLAEQSGPPMVKDRANRQVTRSLNVRRATVLDMSAFLRLAMVLGLALAATATIGTAIG